MPRGGGGRSSSRSGGFGGRQAAPSRNTTAQAPPRQQAPPQTAPVQQQQAQGGMMSGFMGNVVSGVAWGGGMEVGRQAVRSMMGGNSESHQAPAQEQQSVKPCQFEGQQLSECMKNYPNDISMCQNYMDTLKSCQSMNL